MKRKKEAKGAVSLCLAVALALVLAGPALNADAATVSEQEPNDTPAAANTIAVGGTVKGNIADRNDTDWYKFDLTAGGSYKVYLSELPEMVTMSGMEVKNTAYVHVYGPDCEVEKDADKKDPLSVGNHFKDEYWNCSVSLQGDLTTEADGRKYVAINNAKGGTYYIGYGNCPGSFDYTIQVVQVSGGSSVSGEDVEYPARGASATGADGTVVSRDANGIVTAKDASGNAIVDKFASDDRYTYYFMADGTAMQDRLSYHPDGINVIYFDSCGHEVFSNFHAVKKSIGGDPVDDLCFFNVYGYQYVNTVTYDQTGTKLYYANQYGVLERSGWFHFAPDAGNGDSGNRWNFTGSYLGFANADGSLLKDTATYYGSQLVYMQANGEAQ